MTDDTGGITLPNYDFYWDFRISELVQGSSSLITNIYIYYVYIHVSIYIYNPLDRMVPRCQNRCHKD